MTTTEVEAAVREQMDIIIEPAELHAGNIVRAESHSRDSFKHVELVFTVEDACQVSLESYELGELDSLVDIVAAVRTQLTSSTGG